MKKTVKLFSLLMVICMLLSSCAQSAGEVASIISDSIENNSTIENTLDTGAIGTSSDLLDVGNGSNSHAEHLSATNADSRIPEKGTYNEGVALVKYDGEMNDNVLSQLNLVSATALYSGSTWYTVELAAGADTVETVSYLRELGCFDRVDYDYIMGVTAEAESVEVAGNPSYDKSQKDYYKTQGVTEAWKYLEKHGKNPGGSPDVVVAVIDTGVDYNHIDLRNNIWINTAEIPDNGIDDDGNGYIDDVYGWNCVGDNNNPMDDNGHGTHVAGIVAAENNKEGGVGIAYNCKIMVLKAGNSSGYFNNSDIAEAIQYAYMNGASVINMSFAGTDISVPVVEALENAYNTCVLVAAAGNNGRCNQPYCPCPGIPYYPAALPYVIGVMSCNKSGTSVSAFSNYDHYPYNSYEYEVFAVGEGVFSTWPNNKYATLNGTSMAAPMVSGIAALLRSEYPDRETYSTKYLQSQIVNTGEVLYYEKSIANPYDALTKLPIPELNLYDYYIDDSTSINFANNDNGVIDSGETVRLYISLHNRGGVASNVNVSIDTDCGMGMTDPYFIFVNPTMQLSDIGTYSVRESGDKYFEIVVDANCPNDYLADFNIHFTYENGMDEKDKTNYSGDGVAQFNVSRGFHLPATITEDTVYTADKLYIVSQDVVIPEGVTVTFEEGCEIQFYADIDYFNSPTIQVFGVLKLQGASTNPILLYPSEQYTDCACFIFGQGECEMDYVHATNLYISTSTSNIFNSSLRYQRGITYCYDRGDFTYYLSNRDVRISTLQNSYVEIKTYSTHWSINKCVGSFIYAVNSRNLTFTFVCLEDSILYTTMPSESGGGSITDTGLHVSSKLTNNMFYSIDDVNALVPMRFSATEIVNNSFSSLYQQNASQIIKGYYDSTGSPTVDVYDSLAEVSLLWPYIVSVEMLDKNGNHITTVGREEIKVRVTFNRAMDTTQDTFLTFGTIEPYADYRINGTWVSDTVWEGSCTLKAQIENGQNFIKVNNACAADDPTKVVFGEYQLHEFTIDTTEAMSMNLQAIAKENGIELTFAQDDYDTLLGYNIYRADSKDGNYVKLNPAILLPSDSTFVDENAEPGKTYWYTYTVVLTDFTESNPAGKVVATAMDTLAPNMYHTPINQGYTNNNLVISCTASDNVAISAVTLYYRAVGATEWKTLSMSKQSDKYSATIFGSELTLDGVEYYIVATDGRNTINKGSEETPYTVIVKDASSISRKGDVDGDGVVTTKDALMLMQCINGDLILTDDEFKRADLNGDETLSSVETLRILQYINGNVTTLEM